MKVMEERIFGRNKDSHNFENIQLNHDSDMGPLIFRKNEFMEYFVSKRDPSLTTFAWDLMSKHYKLKEHYFLNQLSSYVISWDSSNKQNYQKVLESAEIFRNSALERAEKYSDKDHLLVPKWGNLAWSQILEWVVNPEHEEDWKRLLLVLLFNKDLNGALVPHSKGTIVCIDVLTAPILNILNNCVLEAIDAESKNWDTIFLTQVLPCLMFFIKDKSPMEMPVLIVSHINYEKSKLHTFDQIKFLMAHEIGHYFLKHPSKTRNNLHEFEADIYAISLINTVVTNYMLMEGGDMYLKTSIPVFMGSVELLFHFFGLKEAIFYKLKKEERNETPDSLIESPHSHPPAYERFSNIKSYNTGCLPFDSVFLSKTKKLFEHWLKLIDGVPCTDLKQGIN